MQLKDRINQCLTEKNAKKTDLANATKSPRATISDWTSGKTRSLSGEKLLLASKFFDVNPEWLNNGKGPKHLIHSTGNESAVREERNHYQSQQRTPEAQSLIDIINACENEINNSGRSFTKQEMFDIYFEALEFSGRKHFSKELVNQYISELIRDNVSNK